MPRLDVRSVPALTANAAAEVREQLRAVILDGSLEPGTPLREGEVAATFGVGRTPVRQALKRLQDEGLVSTNGLPGAFVSAARPGAIDEAASVRARIEAYAVERSLPVFIARGFGQLEQLTRQLTEHTHSSHVAAAVDAHIAFHRAFYELAGHRLLLDTWRTLEPALRVHLLSLQRSDGHAELLLRSHRALLDVIRSGRLALIAQHVTDHVMGPDHVPGGPTTKPAHVPPAEDSS